MSGGLLAVGLLDFPGIEMVWAARLFSIKQLRISVRRHWSIWFVLFFIFLILLMRRVLRRVS